MMARLACALSLLALVGAGEASANWNEPVPGTLNVAPALEGESANVANVDGTPYVVWDEDDGTNHWQIRVKRLEAGGWVSVGGSLNTDTSHNGFWEDIANVGGVPYVVWAEDGGSNSYRVHVKRLEAGSWTAVGGVQNISSTADANSTTVADVGGVPYIAWHESDGTHYQVYVKRLEGGAFVPVGGSLNISATRDGSEPVVTGVGGVPYVVWRESDGTHDLVHVKRFDGNAWIPVGNPLNPTQTGSYAPSITDIGGVPYVAWSGEVGTAESLSVARFDGSAWQPVGGSLNTAPSHYSSAPNIADVAGVPVVTWSEDTETTYLLYAKRFDGTGWSMLGANPLNVNVSRAASEPETVSIGGVPYVAFDEYDESNTQKKIRVKRLEPDIGAESATPTATGATLSAQVDDFGLPLPVGFEFGTTAAFGTQTALQSTSGAGASTVMRAIAGLTPQTSYSFRAFGSDGVRQTSLGATQTFTTLDNGGPPPPPPGVPVITNLKLSPAKFAARRGTRVDYDDSQAAATTLTVQRRRACKRCKKRYVSVGSFKHADRAGHNRFRFKGRVKGRRLKPGAYRLRAVPRNAAGAGKAVTKRFRVKRR